MPATINGPSTPPLGTLEPTPPNSKTKRNDALGKEEFLKLLVAQMKNQDPLNPMDGQQMAAQLAQFSSVEQLINANDTLLKIRDLMGAAVQPAAERESQPSQPSQPSQRQ
jgi:flagellar hook assembly protein FlgD